MKLKIKQISTQSKITADFKNFKHIFKQSIAESLGSNGEYLKQLLKSEIDSGSRSGRIREDGQKASVAGEFPKTDTGELSDSVDYYADNRLLVLGASADYAKELQDDMDRLLTDFIGHRESQNVMHSTNAIIEKNLKANNFIKK